MKLVVPVWRKRVAGPWATPSVCMPLTRQRSSAMLAMWGKRSEAQRPDWPRCLNSQRGFMTRMEAPLPVLATVRASSKSKATPSFWMSLGL